jgi:hypothetical protein
MSTITPLAQIEKALGLDELEQDERDQIIADIGDLVFRSSMVRFIERMDEPTKDKFDALMARNPGEEAVVAFLEANDPDADGVIQSAVQDITNDILAVTS